MTNRSARPSERRRWQSRLSTCAASETSSAETGSSHASSAGGTAIARAIAARWRWPPESFARHRRRGLRRQADGGERRPDPVGALLARDAERGQPLGDLLADRHPRRQRRPGVLEDELRRRAAPERDPPARRLLQPDDHPQQRALAAARLADERERAACRHREAHAVDGAQRALAARRTDVGAGGRTRRRASSTTSAGPGSIAWTYAGASAGVGARSRSGSGGPACGPPAGQRPSTPG